MPFSPKYIRSKYQKGILFKIVRRSSNYASGFETLPCARVVSYASCLLLTYKVFYQEKWTCLILKIQKSLEYYDGTSRKRWEGNKVKKYIALAGLAVIIKSATYAIFVTLRSAKYEKSLLAVDTLKDEANGDKGNIFLTNFLYSFQRYKSA